VEFPIKNGDFHSYVSLPEGTVLSDSDFWFVPKAPVGQDPAMTFCSSAVDPGSFSMAENC
jgi:hypothetical protein